MASFDAYLTVDHLDKMNPNFSIQCIVHSEGGLIYKRACDHMSSEGQKLIKNKLNVIGLGPYGLIPKKYGKYAINIYSDKDYITKPNNVTEMMKNSDYKILVVPCIANPSEQTIYMADHNYLSPTYVEARKDLMDYVKSLDPGKKSNEITR